MPFSCSGPAAPATMESEERGLCSALRDVERLARPSAEYMDTQPNVNGNMRAILVDWLVEVHEWWKLVPEVLFLTVDLLDRVAPQTARKVLDTPVLAFRTP